MNSDRFKDRSIPIVFFITTIVAYGLLLPQTGFYWDDWPFAWIAQFLGPKQFIPSFEGVRPFLGPIFLVTTSLIPPVPIYWQLFALLIRFIAGLSVWFALNQVWPGQKQRVLVVSLLFLVFPGYSQHWVAFTHINQEWIPFLFYLLSFGCTVWALRHPQKFTFRTLLAILFLIAGVFPTEYFIGLELIRFFLIWVVVSESTGQFFQRLKKALQLWTPYFLIWLVNALWLTYFYTLGSYDSYDVEVVRQPVSMAQIFMTIMDAIWKMGFYIWAQIVVLVGKSIATPSSLLTVLLFGLTFAFFVWYLFRWDGNSVETKTFAVTVILIGVIGIILGRVPSFAAGLPLKLQSSYDRLTIPMMMGGSLFIVGLIDLLIRNNQIRIYAFALLIALSIGQQFFNANIFRRDWTKQQEIYSQLAWRIPAMKPGTALLTDQMPIDYETDLSFTAPLNWLYAPDYTTSHLPYALIYTEKRLGGPSLPSLVPNLKIAKGMRGATFEGSTSQVIVIYMPRNGCLHVLDPKFGDQVTYAGESHYLVDAIPLSNPDLIIVDSNQTPKLPFLSEPKHTWCYYYTKAELARQRGGWQQVIDLFEEAASFHYTPSDPFEWLVFIEAFGATDHIEVAKQLSDNAMEADGRVRKGLCQVWRRVQAQHSVQTEIKSQLRQILEDFKCAP